MSLPPFRQSRPSMAIQFAFKMPPYYPFAERVGVMLDVQSSPEPQAQPTALERLSFARACKSYFLTKEFLR